METTSHSSERTAYTPYGVYCLLTQVLRIPVLLFTSVASLAISLGSLRMLGVAQYEAVSNANVWLFVPGIFLLVVVGICLIALIAEGEFEAFCSVAGFASLLFAILAGLQYVFAGTEFVVPANYVRVEQNATVHSAGARVERGWFSIHSVSVALTTTNLRVALETSDKLSGTGEEVKRTAYYWTDIRLADNAALREVTRELLANNEKGELASSLIWAHASQVVRNRIETIFKDNPEMLTVGAVLDDPMTPWIAHIHISGSNVSIGAVPQPVRK